MSSGHCPLYQCPLWFQITLLLLGLLTTFKFTIGMLCSVTFECLIVFLAYCGFNVDNSILQTLVFITEMTTALEAFSSRVLILFTNSILCLPKKNSHILPGGQWYAPSAVINDALIMH